jgi:hypothetical protein
LQSFADGFIQSHPQLQPVTPLVDAVFTELYPSREWESWDQLSEELARAVAERLAPAGAAALGARGGAAAAAARKPPASLSGVGAAVPAPVSNPGANLRGYRGESLTEAERAQLTGFMQGRRP